MRSLIAIFIALAVGLPAVAQPAPKASTPSNLTILADEAMLLPMARLARAYASQTQTPLTVVALNADDAEHQIEQGIDAHLIISANTPLIGRLTEQGLTDVSSRRAVAHTQLALVTTSDLNKQADIAERISFASVVAATPTLPIFITDASSIDGERVVALRANEEFSASFSLRLVEKPSLDEVTSSLRDEPSLALILAANAVAEPDVRVLSLLPETISPAVTFEVVVLGSESMAPARALANFIASKEAQTIFGNFGYQPATR